MDLVQNESKNSDVSLEKSEISLSDSWTVLDSSHCKEDGDSSDAESVEVLGCDEHHIDDDLCSCDENDCPKGTVEPVFVVPQPHEETIVNPAEAATTAAAVAAGVAVAAATATAAPHAPWPNPANLLKKQMLHFVLKLSAVSLIVDVLFLAGILLFLRGHNVGCSQEPNALVEPDLNEIDPLPLQLTNMVVGWSKDPLDEHVLARKIFKVMLGYYSQDDITLALEELHKNIMDQEQVISHARETLGTDSPRYRRLVATSHLARSTAAILGPCDEHEGYNLKLYPESNASSLHYEKFAPEPGYWFQDRHTPPYLAFNDTSYMNVEKSLPSYRLHLDLRSPKWNQYFWDVYHQHQVSDSEIDPDVDDEETERSPLDLGTSEMHLTDFSRLEDDMLSCDDKLIEIETETELSDHENLIIYKVEEEIVTNENLLPQSKENDNIEENKREMYKKKNEWTEYGEGESINSEESESTENEEYIGTAVHYPSNLDSGDDYIYGQVPDALDVLRSEIRREEALEKAELNKKVKGSCKDEYCSTKNEKDKKSRKGKEKEKDKVKEKQKKEIKEKEEKKKKKKRKEEYSRKKIQGKNKNDKEYAHVDELRSEKGREAKLNMDRESYVKNRSRGKEGKEKRKYESGTDTRLKEKYKKIQDFIDEERTQERINRKQGSDDHADWNSRMAEGREKLRESHVKNEWWFERARARRKLREKPRSL